MDTSFTKAIKKHPRFYTIIGIPVGIILGYCGVMGIVNSLLGGFVGGLLLGAGITAIPYWNNNQ